MTNTEIMVLLTNASHSTTNNWGVSCFITTDWVLGTVGVSICIVCLTGYMGLYARLVDMHPPKNCVQTKCQQRLCAYPPSSEASGRILLIKPRTQGFVQWCCMLSYVTPLNGIPLFLWGNLAITWRVSHHHFDVRSSCHPLVFNVDQSLTFTFQLLISAHPNIPICYIVNTPCIRVLWCYNISGKTVGTANFIFLEFKTSFEFYWRCVKYQICLKGWLKLKNLYSRAK